jgi:beta-phosphoglucomutase
MLGAIFDLDGVLTDTSRIHERAWRETLHPIPLTTEAYTEHFDGKSRETGLLSFLASMSFEANSTWLSEALGRKDALYLQLIQSEGVKVNADALKITDYLESIDVPMAVASASRNAGLILHKAGIANRFRTIVSGGKKPDSFIAAAEKLGVPFSSCAVFEDSPHAVSSAIEAGAKYVVYMRRDR